jgi:hypothetical protein
MEEVSILKSVLNFISYLHEFFRNFSQFLANYFEPFSSRVNFFISEPSSQRQCRAAPCPDWLPGAAVSERSGRLKSRSDSTVRTAAVRTHRRLTVPRHCPSAPTRAVVRPRHFALPSRPLLSEATPSPGPKPSCSKPSTPPSTPPRR